MEVFRRPKTGPRGPLRSAIRESEQPPPTMPILHLTEADADVHAIARRLSREAERDPKLKGRVTMTTLRKAVEQELDIKLPRSQNDGPVGRLIESGDIVVYPAKERMPGARHGNGTHSVFRASSVDGLHLGKLVEFARSRIRPDHEVPTRRGRTGLTLEVRSGRVINGKQFERIRTMARHVGYHVNPTAESEEEALEAVRGAALMWDPTDGLEGDWRSMYQLIDLSRPKPSQVAEYKSAARTLLDLAAVHGFLLRESIAQSYIVPTSWAPVQERWCTAARHPGVAAVLAVNIVLGAISEVCGADVDPDALTSDQMQRVVGHVQDLLLADRSLTVGSKTSVRRTLRRLMDTKILPEADVSSWDYRQRNRMAAWSATISRKIASSAGADRRGLGLDGGGSSSSGFRDLPGYAAWREFPYPVLADPDHPYSLARVVDFYTAGGMERSRRGFRALGTFPREQPRSSRTGKDAAVWNEVTTGTALGALASFVGWVKRHRLEIDLQRASMLDLLQPEVLKAFTAAVSAGEWSTPGSGQRALVYLGLAASPCLEAEALKREGALADADTFFAAAALVTGRGTYLGDSWDGGDLHGALGQIGNTSPHDDEEDDELDPKSNGFRQRVEAQRARADALEATYRDVLGVDYAYDGMVLLYDRAKAELLQQVGAKSVADLMERWAEIRPSRTFLTTARAMSLWNVLLAAPMRTRTARNVRLRMLKNVGRTLRLAVPRRYLKISANGDYMVDLWNEEAPGFDIEMYNLYLQFVRPALLTSLRRTESTENGEGKYLWVNDWSRGRTARDQVLSATLNKMLRDVVRLGTPGLGREKRGRLLEVAQVHHFRHAVACKLVRLELAERAAMLLHHKGTGTLREVYAARSVAESTGSIRTAAAASVRSGLGERAGDIDLRALLDAASPEQMEQIQRILGAARTRPLTCSVEVPME